MLHNLLQNKSVKRLSSLIITLIAVFAINTAISFAGGENSRATSTMMIPRDMPRP